MWFKRRGGCVQVKVPQACTIQTIGEIGLIHSNGQPIPMRDVFAESNSNKIYR